MTATLPLGGLGPDRSAPVIVDWTPSDPNRGLLVFGGIVAVMAILAVGNRRRAGSFKR